MKKITILVLITVFGFFLRIYLVNQNPPSLNWDEVSHGYNAYSILKTGKDEWGVKMPVIFRAYGDYKLPVYIYLTVISEAVFGFNELAVRFPSVLAGTLSIVFTFLLVRKLFKDEYLGLISTLLMVVEPWGLFLSRVAVEANVASFLIITGVYYFIKGLEKGRWMILSMLLFGLSTHTYNSARILVPLLIIVMLVIYYQKISQSFKKNSKVLLFSGLVIVIIYFPVLFQLISPEGQARYRWINIIDQGAINQIVGLRNKSSLSKPLSRVFYNKLTYFSNSFIKNYLNSFSPNFFFLKGGSNYQFNVPDMGLIYPLEAPFILSGLLILLKRKDDSSKLIIAWLLLSPIPGSITRDSPHTLRLITMLPIPQILTAIGFFTICSWLFAKFKNKKIICYGFVSFYFLLLSFSFVNYWQKYFLAYSNNYSQSWQYGYKQTVAYIRHNYSEYDQILITKKYGEPHEFLLFYWSWEPAAYQQDSKLVRYFKSDWYWVDGFDKFKFVNDWEIKDMVKEQESAFSVSKRTRGERLLLITSPGNYPDGWKLLKTINFLDGKPVFDILEK